MSYCVTCGCDHSVSTELRIIRWWHANLALLHLIVIGVIYLRWNCPLIPVEELILHLCRRRVKGELQNTHCIISITYSYMFCGRCIFLHAKPWIPGGAKSIFAVVIHQWRSPLRQFARAITIDEYDVTMPVPPVRATSQINCDDVTIFSQKRPSLWTIAK